MYILKMRIVDRVLCQTGDDALHVQVVEVVNGARLQLHLFMAVGADHAIASPGRLLLNAVEHGCIVVSDQVWHYHAYHPWCFLAQALCKRVRPVVHLPCPRLHFLAHLRSDFRTTVQRTADRSDAHPKFTSKILERRSAFTHAGKITKNN